MRTDLYIADEVFMTGIGRRGRAGALGRRPRDRRARARSRMELQADVLQASCAARSPTYEEWLERV